MRKFLAASVVCLLAFAGQAMASDGGGGFSLPFCAPVGVPSDRAPAPDAHAFGVDACTIASLAAVAGLITVIALTVSNSDNSKSA